MVQLRAGIEEKRRELSEHEATSDKFRGKEGKAD
jgi:hypothetical protein